VKIGSVVSTELFVGPEDKPRQLHRVTVLGGGTPSVRAGVPLTVRIAGAGVTTPEPVTVAAPPPDGECEVDVAVDVDGEPAEGDRITATVSVTGGGNPVRRTVELTMAVPGWTMFLVPHFHYDPFWWNTQAGYLTEWDELPQHAQDARKPGQAAAFDLVEAHLDLARRDCDYKFVLAELDYLRPYWDAHPQNRAELRELIAQGRVELAGGMYNEPNTNLTSLESTIRNIVHGSGFHRHVIGSAPRTGWMLDVFGHDPAFPSVLADAGMTAVSYARGPFHTWGPEATADDGTGMQFASEVEWIAPDGTGLLSGYLAHHYPAGWKLNDMPTLADAEALAYTEFCQLKRVAATRNVLLPVGYNHVVPARWTTDIHREWNKKYTWPRFVCALPGEFFAAVRADAERRDVRFSPQSRDLNPVYPGKDVSYIDIKQGQRAAETALAGAEKLATLMTVLGADYPAEAIDKAWRQLFFGAHHDGITGVNSDQVYLDLLGGWREAYALGTQARADALAFLAGRVDTRGPGRPLLVVNTQSWPRTEVARVSAEFPADGPRRIAVHDDAGRPIAAVLEAATRHPDGSLAAVTLSFVAADVPATGHRVYHLVETDAPATGWITGDGCRAENEVFAVEADPARGGALSSILDKRSGRELLRSGEVAAVLVVDEEYDEHPGFRKGPWHLTSRGVRTDTTDRAATVRMETSAAGRRLVTTCDFDAMRITTEITVWYGVERLDFRTRVDGSIAEDRLMRVRFPFELPGARPVYEVGNAVIGRTFGNTGVDVAEHPYVLDSPAYTWTGLSSAARIAVSSAGSPTVSQAIGVAEVVAPTATDGLRELVAALAQQGVTATTSPPDGSRHGSLSLDSNLPDVRVSLGGPADNPFTARVLAAADPWYAARLADLLAMHGAARLWVPATRTRQDAWVPGTDLRGERDLPVLIIAGPGSAAGLAADLADATVDLEQPDGPDGPAIREPLTGYSAAVLNRGTPGAVVEPDGTVSVSLLRSCTGWPTGTWIEPPRRTAPDGSSFAVQHWTHTFEYAVVAGAGDWRQAGFVRAGHGYNDALLSTPADPHDGELPPVAGLLRAEPANVIVTAIKPEGNPLADGGAATVDGGLTVRCFETDGRPVRARIDCFAPLREGVLTDVLERPKDRLDTPDGTLVLDLGAAATVTATAMPRRAAPPAVRPRAGADEPVYSRYWLHNKGAAPLGHQPATVFVEPRSVRLDEPASVRVTVSATSKATGQLELDVPPGVRVSSVQDLSFDLDDDFRVFDLRLLPEPGGVRGVGHLTTRIVLDDGPSVEDVCTLRFGGAEPADGRLVADVSAMSLTVAPGTSAQIAVRLANPSSSAVRAEVQMLTPYGFWDEAGPWARTVVVGPGAAVDVPFSVDVAPGRPPAETWALFKVMSSGEVQYTPAVPLTVPPA
jgi:alpha-mannosidase